MRCNRCLNGGAHTVLAMLARLSRFDAADERSRKVLGL